MKPLSGGVIENAGPAPKYDLARPGIMVLAGMERTDLVDENWKVFYNLPIPELIKKAFAGQTEK